MKIPKGTEPEATKNMVYKLLKALYNFKQSPHLWYKRLLTFFLKKLGLKHIHANYSIFALGTRLKSLMLSIFINDIKIIMPKDNGIIQQIKTKLTAVFFILVMDIISFYPRLKIDRDREQQTIKLSQPAYIKKVLEKFYPHKLNPVNTPIKKFIPFS